VETKEEPKSNFVPTWIQEDLVEADEYEDSKPAARKEEEQREYDQNIAFKRKFMPKLQPIPEASSPKTSSYVSKDKEYEGHWFEN